MRERDFWFIFIGWSSRKANGVQLLGAVGFDLLSNPDHIARTVPSANPTFWKFFASNYSKCWVEARWRQAETKRKNCEQSGFLLCSWVRGPVNLAGPLEILAKVWLHENLEKGDQKEWSCTLQVGLVVNPLLGTMEGLPPSLLHSFRFSSHQPPNKKLCLPDYGTHTSFEGIYPRRQEYWKIHKWYAWCAQTNVGFAMCNNCSIDTVFSRTILLYVPSWRGTWVKVGIVQSISVFFSHILYLSCHWTRTDDTFEYFRALLDLILKELSNDVKFNYSCTYCPSEGGDVVETNEGIVQFSLDPMPKQPITREKGAW